MCRRPFRAKVRMYNVFMNSIDWPISLLLIMVNWWMKKQQIALQRLHLDIDSEVFTRIDWRQFVHTADNFLKVKRETKKKTFLLSGIGKMGENCFFLSFSPSFLSLPLFVCGLLDRSYIKGASFRLFAPKEIFAKKETATHVCLSENGALLRQTDRQRGLKPIFPPYIGIWDFCVGLKPSTFWADPLCFAYYKPIRVPTTTKEKERHFVCALFGNRPDRYLLYTPSTYIHSESVTVSTTMWGIGMILFSEVMGCIYS